VGSSLEQQTFFDVCKANVALFVRYTSCIHKLEYITFVFDYIIKYPISKYTYPKQIKPLLYSPGYSYLNYIKYNDEDCT